jgi:hypothetical protein
VQTDKEFKMLKKLVAGTVFAASLLPFASPMALADGTIEGSWQATGVRCQDGKTPQLHGMDVAHSLINYQGGKFAVVLPMEMNGQNCKILLHGDYKVSGGFLYSTNQMLSGCGADETSMPDDLHRIDFGSDGSMTVTANESGDVCPGSVEIDTYKRK